ncbi:hypothetical protein [Kribbella sp. HUAS MG21]|uniref:Uncharacterized protein n=1 Tax=Kribbella sp. HUAS MG21 TaxID=3160966 RepID=A0AAU7TLS3_9ACTN
MSPEANRSESNLVLMCLLHSRTIDDHESEFPPDLLRQWKAAAEASNDGVQPPLTDAEVGEIQKYIVAATIVQADVIHLGGTLGGGGGAIGAGAYGGQGGNITIADLNTPTRTPQTDAAQPDVGDGFSEGFDGQDGGTSSFGSGSTLLAAGGGGGGFVGTGNRSTTDRLRVSTLVLVNAVEHREGLVSILGGAWDKVVIEQLPAQGSIYALAVIEAGGAPQGEYGIHIAAFGPNGTRLARVSFPVTVTQPGQVLRFKRHVALDLDLTQQGIHTVTVDSDISELARIEFAVVLNDGPQA